MVCILIRRSPFCYGNLTETFMPLDSLKNLLFPRKASWQQKQQTKVLLIAILVAVLFAGTVAGFMFYINSKR